MLVSIITPVFNAVQYVEETIKSVLKQSYTNWELIIVDDCSTDKSIKVIEKYISVDARIKLFSLPKNSGVAVARNYGLHRAQGRYIAFLDSDDLWDETKLETQLAKITRYNYAVCYAAYRKIDANGNTITKHVPVREEGINYFDLLKHNEIGFLTAIYDLEQVGKQDFVTVGHEDYVLWLSILKKGFIAYGVNEVLASYRVHSEGISSNKLKSAFFTWNIYRNVEKLGLLEAIYFFLNYAIRSTAKKFKR